MKSGDATNILCPACHSKMVVLYMPIAVGCTNFGCGLVGPMGVNADEAVRKFEALLSGLCAQRDVALILEALGRAGFADYDVTARKCRLRAAQLTETQ